MTQSPTLGNASKAAEGAGRSAHLTQAHLDRIVGKHQRFLDGRLGGARAILRFIDGERLDLSGRRLSDVDFCGANLRGVKLAGAALERASFYCADLQAADARGANLRRADLRGASLREACLEGACLDEADMRAAMLCEADGEGFHQAGAVPPPTEGRAVHSVDFKDSSLKGARLSGARLKGANFQGANLHGADFRNARLDGACFDNAILTGVRIRDLHVDSRRLASCLLDPTEAAKARTAELLARLSAVDVWITSGGRRGAAAVFDGEDLRPLGKAFVRARLTAASARGACAVGVDFTGCQLQGARFDGADLRDADFRKADLRGVSFAGANLCHARFDGADITPLTLPDGVVREVDFTDAKMAGVQLPAPPAAAAPDLPSRRERVALEI